MTFDARSAPAALVGTLLEAARLADAFTVDEERTLRLTLGGQTLVAAPAAWWSSVAYEPEPVLAEPAFDPVALDVDAIARLVTKEQVSTAHNHTLTSPVAVLRAEVDVLNRELRMGENLDPLLRHRSATLADIRTLVYDQSSEAGRNLVAVDEVLRTRIAAIGDRLAVLENRRPWWRRLAPRWPRRTTTQLWIWCTGALALGAALGSWL